MPAATRSALSVTRVSPGQTALYTPLVGDYLAQQPALQAFYAHAPTPDGVVATASARHSFPAAQRALLADVLRHQYADLWTSPAVRDNLAALTDPRTFTITTGHQLNLFGGPLYFLYKIVSAVRTAHAMNAHDPTRRYVPVFWLASEDHDFDEIRFFNLPDRRVVWDSHQTGAVGRFRLDGLATLLDHVPEADAALQAAYRTQPTLAAATRYLVNHLFGDQGVLVLDADEPRCKSLLTPVIQDELTESAAARAGQATTEALTQAGYSPQIHLRDLNFFYLTDQHRARLVRHAEGHFEALGTGQTFGADELLALAETHPERFSPNVALRPLYQEMLLPNVAYVGGPAEVAYWLQLKGIFDRFAVPYPVVLPRHAALIVDQKSSRLMHRLGFAPDQLLADEAALIADYLHRHGEGLSDLQAEWQAVADVFAHVRAKATQADPTLTGFVAARQRAAEKLFEQLSKRLRRAETDREALALRQLRDLRERLFPAGKLQERHTNFLAFRATHPDLVAQLMAAFAPFDFRFCVLMEDEQGRLA